MKRLIVLGALLGMACGDDSLVRVKPSIEVTPESLDFGEGIVDQDNVLLLTIRNRGGVGSSLEILSARSDNPAYRVDVLPEPIGGGGNLTDEMAVIFVPRRAHEVYEGTLTIESNDEDNPFVLVPLTGVGGVREIEVFPLEIDFGIVDEGTVHRKSIEIRNIGKDPLNIPSITFTSTSVDMYIPEDTFTSGVLLPMTSTTVDIEYAPIDQGFDSGVVTIFSNDEDEPQVEVPVRGHANLAPIAIAWGCRTQIGQTACDGVEKVKRVTLSVRERMGLEGRESFDPEGGPITSYEWVVVERPPESVSPVFHSMEDRVERNKATGDIEVDVSGRYDLRLIVTDERGLESFDLPEAHVQITPKDLEVLLSWDVGTDVDLHLVRPGGAIGEYGSGAVGTSTGSDCSTFNRAPNWGDPMTRSDDPSLDIDDVTGTGPEIVSLDSPEAGQYTVYAHYCDSRQVMVPVEDVVIEVLVRGEPVLRVPTAGSSFGMTSGELWEVATVEWDASGPEPTAIVTPSDAPPTLRPELCNF